MGYYNSGPWYGFHRNNQLLKRVLEESKRMWPRSTEASSPNPRKLLGLFPGQKSLPCIGRKTNYRTIVNHGVPDKDISLERGNFDTRAIIDAAPGLAPVHLFAHKPNSGHPPTVL